MITKGFMDGYRTYTGGGGTRAQWRVAFDERMGIDEAKVYAARGAGDSTLADLRSARTAGELRRVYLALMRKHHPDRGGDVELAKTIVATYLVLKERFGSVR